MTNNANVAASWLAALAARGVRVYARGKQLRMDPPSAYKELSDDEHAVFRRHKAEIRALVAAGVQPATVTLIPKPDRRAEAPPPPAPVQCPYCHQTPCVGKNHHSYDVLHWSDPEEVKRRNEDAMDQHLAYAQGWPTERMIARAREREPVETAEQRQQREIRVRLGWEVEGGTRKI